MVWLRRNPVLMRAAAMLVVVAIAVLPLIHTRTASAAPQPQNQADACCVSGCDSCPCCPETEQEPCCPPEESPDDPSSEGEQPCNCPCCGKVLPAVPMIPTASMDGPFWADSQSPTPITLAVRPDSASVRVDIQPPIV